MTKLQAVLLSAEHWLKNWEDPANASYDADDCACCLYSEANKFPGSSFCGACPIRQFTGRAYCDGTPYTRAADVIDDYQSYFEHRYPDDDVYYKAAKKACEEEYEFVMEVALQLQPEQEDFDYDFDPQN